MSAAIAALCVVGFALRFVRLGRASLWFDEGYTAWVASLPVREIVRVIRVDTAPPLYYLLLHGWTQLCGSSETGLRSFSAVCSAAAMGLGVLTARQLFRRPAAVLAASALLAVGYMPAAFAHEARFYGAMLLLTAASLYGAASAAQRFSVVGGAGMLLCWSASLYTSHAMLPYVAATAFAWWAFPGPVRRSRRAAHIVAVGAGVCLAYLPWVSTALRQSQQVRGNFWASRPAVNELPEVLTRLSGINPDLFTNARAAEAAVVIVIAVACGVGLIIRRREGAGLVLALAAVGVGPVLASFVMSRLFTPMFLDRSLIGSCAALPLLLASPLEWVVAVPVRILWTTVLGCLAVASFESQRGQILGEHREDWRGVSAFVQAESEAMPAGRPSPASPATPASGRRLIVFAANEGELLFDYYARGGTYTRSPELSGAPESFFATDMNPPRTMRRVRSDADLSALRSAVATVRPRQLFFVESHPWWADPDGRALQWLEDHFRLAERHRFGLITVYRFVPRDAEVAR